MSTFEEIEEAYTRARRLGAQGVAEDVVAKLILEGAPYETIVAAIPPTKPGGYFSRARKLGARGKQVGRVVKLLKANAPFEEVMAAITSPVEPHPKYGFIRRRNEGRV